MEDDIIKIADYFTFDSRFGYFHARSSTLGNALGAGMPRNIVVGTLDRVVTYELEENLENGWLYAPIDPDFINMIVIWNS